MKEKINILLYALTKYNCYDEQIINLLIDTTTKSASWFDYDSYSINLKEFNIFNFSDTDSFRLKLSPYCIISTLNKFQAYLNEEQKIKINELVQNLTPQSESVFVWSIDDNPCNIAEFNSYLGFYSNSNNKNTITDLPKNPSETFVKYILEKRYSLSENSCDYFMSEIFQKNIPFTKNIFQYFSNCSDEYFRNNFQNFILKYVNEDNLNSCDNSSISSFVFKAHKNNQNYYIESKFAIIELIHGNKLVISEKLIESIEKMILHEENNQFNLKIIEQILFDSDFINITSKNLMGTVITSIYKLGKEYPEQLINLFNKDKNIYKKINSFLNECFNLFFDLYQNQNDFNTMQQIINNFDCKKLVKMLDISIKDPNKSSDFKIMLNHKTLQHEITNSNQKNKLKI